VGDFVRNWGEDMQIHLSPEIEAKLNRLADARGGNAEEVAREAIEQFVNYDDWLLTEVEKGSEPN